MSNQAILYWITRLDAIHSTFVVFLIITSMFLIIKLLANLIGGDDISKGFKRILNKISWVFIPLFIVSLFGTVFSPTKNEALLIIGGGAAMDYVEKDTTLQQIPGKATKLVVKIIDDKLKELDNVENK